jgi:hypothetical protein
LYKYQIFIRVNDDIYLSIVHSFKNLEMNEGGEERVESREKMEETRRNLRRLTVEEEEKEQASNDRVGKVKAAALEDWGKLKEMLGGKNWW